MLYSNPSEFDTHTCAFYRDELVLKIRFYLLDATELIQRAGHLFNTTLTGYGNCEKCL